MYGTPCVSTLVTVKSKSPVEPTMPAYHVAAVVATRALFPSGKLRSVTTQLGAVEVRPEQRSVHVGHVHSQNEDDPPPLRQLVRPSEPSPEHHQRKRHGRGAGERRHVETRTEEPGTERQRECLRTQL